MDKRDWDDSKDKPTEDDRESSRDDDWKKSYEPHDTGYSEGERETPSIADTIEPPDEPPKK